MHTPSFLAHAAGTLLLVIGGGAALAAERGGRPGEKPLDLTVRRDAAAWTGVRDKAPIGEQKQAALPLRERERDRVGRPLHGQPYGAGYEARVMRADTGAAPAASAMRAGPAPATAAAPSPAGGRGHR